MNGPNSDINRQQVLREMPSAPRDAFKATVLWSMLGAFGGGSGFPAKQRVSAPLGRWDFHVCRNPQILVRQLSHFAEVAARSAA
jgi:hypothetical protein